MYKRIAELRLFFVVTFFTCYVEDDSSTNLCDVAG